jgi:hypothetical protein
MTLAVPDNLDEVLSTEWLTAALEQRFPGISVTRVTQGPVISRVSTNARFRIECADGVPDGLSPHLCVKGYFGQEAQGSRQAGIPEAYFYRDLADEIGVRTLRSLLVRGARGRVSVNGVSSAECRPSRTRSPTGGLG